MKNWKFFLMMIIAVLVWAAAFPFIKIGLEELSFINLTIMRFLIVCISFIFILVIKKNVFTKIHKKDILPIFILGFFGVIIYHLGLNYGEQFISAGAASLIIATIPILIVIFALIFLKEKITHMKIIGIIIALIGVVIISILGTNQKIEINYAIAAIAVFVAALMGAFYTIAGKKMLERYTGFSLTAYAMLFGSIGLIPFIRMDLFSEVSNMSINGWFAIIFLGVFSTVIGYGIWYIGLNLRTASEISIYLYAIPVISTIISYFLLNEKITLFFVFGGALVILGLILVNLKNKKIHNTVNNSK